jgi:hypothetical protein
VKGRGSRASSSFPIPPWIARSKINHEQDDDLDGRGSRCRIRHTQEIEDDDEDEDEYD